MAFSEAVKLDAKRRANFRCVVCYQPWIEVHHIIPQQEGGPDTIDNAAPLCHSCHGRYGGNPDLRKQLREMRDWWWQRCSEDRPDASQSQLAERLDTLQISLAQGQKRQDEVLQEMKGLITEQFRLAEQQISASGTVDGVLSVTSSLSTGFPPRSGPA